MVKGHFAGGIVGENNYGTITDCTTYEQVTVKGYFAGGIVGRLYSGSITNCRSSAAVAGNRQADGTATQAGGIAGYILVSEVNQCSAPGTITNENGSYSGGIIGLIDGATGDSSVRNCDFTGNIVVSDATDSFAGGIAGAASGTIENCQVSGTITMQDAMNCAVGGIAGSLSAQTAGNRALNCDADCVITIQNASFTDVGGIVGRLFSEVSNCHASGDCIVTASASHHRIGGIAGMSRGKITCSYMTGTIEITDNTSAATIMAGGIAGISDGKINCCYAAGALSVPFVSPETYIGGIVGVLLAYPSVSDESFPSHVFRSVSLLAAVDGTAGKTGRIAGSIMSDTPTADNIVSQSNYAFAGMTVNGTLPQTDGSDSMQGVSASPADLYKINWWQNNPGWSDCWGGGNDTPWVSSGSTDYPLPVLYWETDSQDHALPPHLLP